MISFTNSPVRSVLLTGATTKPPQFGQSKKSESTSQASASSATDQVDLSESERIFRKRLDGALAYQYRGNTLVPPGAQNERYLRTFYKEQYPLKLQELKDLRKTKAEKQKQLQVLQNSLLGSKAKKLGLAVAGGAAEVAVHAMTAGLSLPIHGIGAVVGGIAGKALVANPEAVKEELSNIEMEEEELLTYLENLQNEYDRKFSKKRQSADTSEFNYRRTKPFQVKRQESTELSETEAHSDLDGGRKINNRRNILTPKMKSKRTNFFQDTL